MERFGADRAAVLAIEASVEEEIERITENALAAPFPVPGEQATEFKPT